MFGTLNFVDELKTKKFLDRLNAPWEENQLRRINRKFNFNGRQEEYQRVFMKILVWDTEFCR